MYFHSRVKARIAASLLILLPAAAVAADLGGYRPYRQADRRPLDNSYRTPLQQVSVWTGLYAGIHGGGGWGSTDGTFGATNGSIDTDGYLFGAHAGYNMQIGRWVTGFELDGAWTDIEGSRTFGISQVKTSHDWLSSARVRLGYAVNDWMLIYATGGLGLSGAEVRVTELGATATRSETLLGYAVGGGVDLKLTSNMSGRLEAIHYGFGEESFNFPGGTIRGDADVTTVRAGLTFHLN